MKTTLRRIGNSQGVIIPKPILAQTFQGKRGLLLLDQIRTIDKARLIQRLGASEKTLGLALEALHEMFAL